MYIHICGSATIGTYDVCGIGNGNEIITAVGDRDLQPENAGNVVLMLR